MEEEKAYQLVYFPYLSLGDVTELRYGRLSVWNAGLLSKKLPAGPLRGRVAALLESHRAPSGRADKSRPETGIGIVSRGRPDFEPIVPRWIGDVQELRYALFLSCLSNGVTRHGPNAAHFVLTAENFSFVTQGISLEREYISETTGVLVTVTHLGYRIGEVQFPTPTHVPRPLKFDYDQRVFDALRRLRSADRSLYRRVIDATSLLLESYHNTHAVDVRARILLQPAAFEVLLDLPDKDQRKAFKDLIEQHSAVRQERRYRYKYETRGGLVPESRTQKGIWADRFYTLRNHIIHGERVSASRYVYRGSQHHVLIAAAFFVHVAKRLIESALSAVGRPVKFYSRIDWHEPGRRPDEEDGDDEERVEGFRASVDHAALFDDRLAAAGY